MAAKPIPAPPATRNTIWCLFSVDNNYDQPENNLVRWWSVKPTIETLAKSLSCPMDKATDEDIVAVVAIWQGKPTELRLLGDQVQYRLQEVGEAEAI